MHTRLGRTRSRSPSSTAAESSATIATQYVEKYGGDHAATEAVVIRLSALGEKARGVAWKDMTIGEQIASLAGADKDVGATMAYSWCEGDPDLTEIISQQSEDDLSLMAFILGIPLPSNIKKLSVKNLIGLRESIVERILVERTEHPNVSGLDAAGDRMQELRVRPPVRQPSPEKKVDTSSSSSSSTVSHPKSAINLAFQIPPVSEKLPLVATTTQPTTSIRMASSRPPRRNISAPFSSDETSVPKMIVTADPSSSSSRPSLFEQGEEDMSDSSDEEEPDEDSSPGYRGGRMTSKELRHEMMRSGIGLSFAAEWIENAHKVSGIQGPSPINDLYRLQKIPDYQQRKLPYMNTHAKEEMLALTRIIDALVRRDIDEALEHATRRLGGLETAILTNSWEVCNKLTTSYEQHNFVPKFFLASALKSVHREQAIKKSASSSSSSSSSKYSESDYGYRSGRSSRRNRDETYSSHRNQNSGSNKSSTRGTSSQRAPSTSGSRSSSGRDPSRQ